jgi:hypothetical protein
MRRNLITKNSLSHDNVNNRIRAIAVYAVKFIKNGHRGRYLPTNWRNSVWNSPKKQLNLAFWFASWRNSWGNSPIGGIRGEIRQLAKLLLAKTGIGDGILHQGAQHLAHALQSNAVREVLFSSVTCQLLCFNTQTLTILNLYANRIGAEGAQHLAHALQSNAVREVLSSSVTYQLIPFNTDTHYAGSL